MRTVIQRTNKQDVHRQSDVAHQPLLSEWQLMSSFSSISLFSMISLISPALTLRCCSPSFCFAAVFDSLRRLSIQVFLSFFNRFVLLGWATWLGYMNQLNSLGFWLWSRWACLKSSTWGSFWRMNNWGLTAVNDSLVLMLKDKCVFFFRNFWINILL